MNRVFEIHRFDPETDEAPRFERHEIEAEPSDRVLDCLNRIRWERDPSLSFRASCAHGVCGSDAMRIDGVCALACQRLVKDLGAGPIRIEPLPGFPVLKDLVVDLEGFFEKVRAVRPYLLPADEAPERERLQTPEERAAFDEAIRCILCGCCTGACPVTETDEAFLGPAALLRGFRYLFDSRDGADVARLVALDSPAGAPGCKTHWKCTEVCPKEIPVTKSIGRIKRAIFEGRKAGRLPDGETG